MQSRTVISGLLVALLALVMVAAFVVMRSGKATVAGMEPSVPRAAFIVVNTGTLTGFQTPATVDDYKFPGQLVVFMLIVCCTLVMLIAGGTALVKILDMPFDGPQIAVASGLIYLMILLIGT